MVADPVRAYGLQDCVCADDVGVHEGPRVPQRVVVVRLGGKVHDDVRVAHQLVDEWGVRHVSLDERDRASHRTERRTVAGVRQGVEDGDVDLRALAHRELDEVRADEAGSAGDEQTHG